MELTAPFISRYIRIIAIISLLLGLSDAARLLGVGMGPRSPVDMLGVSGFTFLAIFSLARIFAAVGLWIRASWGVVLLIGATVAELALYLLGSPDVRLNLVGFSIRFVLLVAILAILALGLRIKLARAAD
jgi:hypothetical protein